MRRYLQVLLGLMLLLSSAAAQNADTEEFIARMRAFTSVFNLAFIIDQFPVLDRTRGAELTKVQAQQLIPILQDLEFRSALSPTQADDIIKNIETRILRSEQLKVTDDAWLKRQEEARRRTEEARRGGATPLKPSDALSLIGPIAAEYRVLIENISQGKSFNYFALPSRHDALIVELKRLTLKK